MKKLLLLSCAFSFLSGLSSQNVFTGIYNGPYEGDQVEMILEQSGAQVYGTMQDSYQTYLVDAIASGTGIIGTASESTLGLILAFDGNIAGNELQLNLSLDQSGFKIPMPGLLLTKSVASNNDYYGSQYPEATQEIPSNEWNNYSNTNTSTYIPALPSDAYRDPALMGEWYKEEMYNSSGGFDGYYMSTSTRTGISYNSDGSVSDLGSSTTISTSDAYGNSASNGYATIPNTCWFTRNNHVYLLVEENGKKETVEIGKYYIENSSMLITTPEGKKTLFQR